MTSILAVIGLCSRIWHGETLASILRLSTSTSPWTMLGQHLILGLLLCLFNMWTQLMTGITVELIFLFSAGKCYLMAGNLVETTKPAVIF